MNADAILAALKSAGLPVASVHIGDPADVTTWVFQQQTATGLVDLDEADRAAAVAVVTTLATPTPAHPTVSKLNFLRLLTPAEWGTLQQRAVGGDATLQYAMALLDASFQLTPTEPTFVQMLAYCVGIGVFTQDRAAAIVAAMGAA